MDRITKHDLERRLDLLNSYVGENTYEFSWANGGVRISYGEGADVGRRGTKRDIYHVLGGMCDVAALFYLRSRRSRATRRRST